MQFNYQGWYVTSGFEDRFASIAPTNTSISEVEGALRSNWTGHVWVEMPYVAPIVPVPTIEVPQSITPRQARLALLQVGLLDDVEALLTLDKAMQIWWEYSLEVDRNNPHIVNAGLALGMSESQLNDLFILGASL